MRSNTLTRVSNNPGAVQSRPKVGEKCGLMVIAVRSQVVPAKRKRPSFFGLIANLFVGFRTDHVFVGLQRGVLRSLFGQWAQSHGFTFRSHSRLRVFAEMGSGLDIRHDSHPKSPHAAWLWGMPLWTK